MTRARSASGGHTASWILFILCMLATLYIMLATAAIDLGAAAHDAFCPEHGRLV